MLLTPVGKPAAKGVAASRTPAAGPSSVQVEVAGHQQTVSAGVDALLVGLTRTDDGKASGRMKVTIDYRSIAQAYGGGWGSRLHLVAMPGCVLTTPQVASCQVRKPLATTNDAVARTLSASVDLPARTAAAPDAAADAQTQAVAAVSGDKGSQGDYTATSLSASGSWSQTATGAFTYNYPIAVPASLGGASPAVSLSYNSQSIDGETSARNAQSSWIGDGWSYSPGFIERSYKSCADDGIKDSGDECWAGYNAALSLGSHNGQLVRASDGSFHLQADDGTKIERLTGADNGLWQGEYYKVTTTDGTAYYFGIDHTPGTTSDTSTDSAWGVPVFHPKSSDPCYDAAKGDKSRCDKPLGYRFNLDFVVDPHGNVQRYDYGTETNYYNMGLGQVAASGGGGTMTRYVRGGYLKQISYGYQLADAQASKDPAARIEFTTAQRCITSETVCTIGNLSDSTATNWPDVPYDIHCDAGDPTSGDGDDVCHTASPTFWSTYRLKTITTQVKVGSSYKNVDSYTLTHLFSDAGGVIDPITGKSTDPADAGQLQAVMWLSSIQHTGLDTSAGGSGPITLDPITFTGIETDNRVDGLTPGAPPLYHPRISSIQTETGESIGIGYATPQCSRVNNTMPASADTNTKTCFPVYWSPPGAADPISDWFNKSLVTDVTDNDLTAAGSPQKSTHYEYGTPAWHRDDSDLTDDQYRTWDDFRGFDKVTTTTGTNPATKSVTTYLQGMDGDYKADGTTRSVAVAGITDSDWLAGMPVETDTYNTTAAGAPIVAKDFTDAPTTHVTATRSRTAWTSKDPAPAHLSTLPDLTAVGTTTTSGTSQALLANGSWRTAKSITDYDAHGRVTKVDHQGDVSDPKQETCTTTGYAAAPASNPMMLSYPSQTRTVSGPCGTTPGPTTTLTDKHIFYDSDGSITDPGTFGVLGQGWPSDGSTPKAHSLGYMTAVQTIKSYDSTGAPTYQITGALTYDKYGRVTRTLDGAGSPTSTAYSPADTTLPTSVTTTNPLGWQSTTTIDPARGAVTESTDANGRITDSTFDALGRRTAAWLPGHDKASNPDSPNKKFSYSVHGAGANPAPSTVTTHTLRENAVYNTAISLYDGMLQLRQTQTTTANNAAGRLITSYAYDSHGWPVSTIPTYDDPANAPSTTLWAEDTTTLLSQTKAVYDGLGRPVETQMWGHDNYLLWKGTTSYPGADETVSTPPDGGQTTAAFTDGSGRTTATTVKDTTPDRTLPAGTVIASGSSFASNSVRLTMQADGNLVLQGITSGTQLWSSGTSGNPGASAAIRTDGSFVITSATGTVLKTLHAGTTGATGAYLMVRDDASAQVYNSAGTSTWTSGTAGEAAAADATTHYTYTPTGQPSTVTDAVGNVWSYQYDVRGELISQHDPDAGDSTYGYDDLGHLAQTTDPRGQVLSYTYDILGRTTAEYAEATTPTHDPSTELASWAYDTLADGTAVKGLPVSSTRYAGGANGSAYIKRIDGYNTSYQPTGTSTVIPAAEGALAGTYTSTALYTPNMGLLDETSYGADGGLPAESIGFEHDQQGLVTSSGTLSRKYLNIALYSPLGQIQESTYGELGKQLRTDQTYDAATRRLVSNSVKLQTATVAPIDVTTYGYDAAGNIKAVSDEQSDGNGSSATDTQCFDYDGLGRLSQAWSDTQGMTTPAVSGQGQIAGCTTAVPSAATIGGPAPYWQSYSYDLLGDRTQMVGHDVGGNALKNTTQTVAYPSTTAAAALPNQATSVTTSNPTTGTAVSTLDYQDTSSNPAGVNAGAITSRDSTTTGSFVSGVKSATGGAMCMGDSGGHTTDGNPQILWPCGGGGQTYTVGTDGTVKVLGKCLDTASDTPAKSTGVVINTCSASRPTQMWRATASGTLVNVTSGLCLADPGANPANATKQILWTCGASGQTYTTPATGTSVAAGQSQTIAYDQEGRTRSVVTNDGTQAKKTDYLYDADGGLLIERNPKATVLYLFGGAEQLTLAAGATTLTGQRYYANPDGTTIVRDSSGKLTYLPSNPQGTSQLSVDASTLALTRRSYDPYGAPRGTEPTSWTDNHGYLGKPTDPVSGLDLLGARDYDPTLGRFLSVDPVFEAGDPSQMGGYAYSADDPVNGSDPTGLMLDGGGNCGVPANPCNPDPPQPKPSRSKAGSAKDQAAGAADGVAGTVASLFNMALPHEIQITTHPVAKMLDADTDTLRYKYGEVTGGAATLVIPGVGEESVVVDTLRSEEAADEAIGLADRVVDQMFGHTPTENPEPVNPDVLQHGHPSSGPVDPEPPAAPTPASEAARPSSDATGTADKPAARSDEPVHGKAPKERNGKCSFSPDTPVLLGQGKTKPISDVTVGDKVESGDPKTGKHAGTHTVTATWVNHDTDLIDVTVRGTDGKPATLHTTSKHPFWDDTTHTWVPAGELKPGELLNTAKDLHATVLAVRVTPGAANRYNLTVAQLHSYYVLAGTTPILVHNTCGPTTAPEGHVYRGGLYKYQKDPATGRNVPGTEINHMPPNSINGVPRDRGPAIQMDKADHYQTASWGRSREAIDYRARQQTLIDQGDYRGAIQMDIDDIQSKFGAKYDNAIREMIYMLPPGW